MVEESQPAFIEQAVQAFLRQAGQYCDPRQGCAPHRRGIHRRGRFGRADPFPGKHRISARAKTKIRRPLKQIQSLKEKASEFLKNRCRRGLPDFAWLPGTSVFHCHETTEKETGPLHVSADIGCHTFSTLPPFNIGNTVLGYGLGLASSAGVAPAFGGKNVVSIMGDGGFWHNGLTTGVASSVFNRNDGVLVIMNNGYTSATGAQHIPSTGTNAQLQPTGMDMVSALKGLGVKWIRTVNTYQVSKGMKVLREALNTSAQGLKVIIAESECMLPSRGGKTAQRKMLQQGKRVVRTRFGVDSDTCTGIIPASVFPPARP